MVYCFDTLMLLFYLLCLIVSKLILLFICLSISRIKMTSIEKETRFTFSCLFLVDCLNGHQLRVSGHAIHADESGVYVISWWEVS